MRQTIGRLRESAKGSEEEKMALIAKRTAKIMVFYPAVYVVLTLPLAVGRMWSMSHDGEQYSDTCACVVGVLLTSCGWVDCLLYTLTRQRLLSALRNDTQPDDEKKHITSGDHRQSV